MKIKKVEVEEKTHNRSFNVPATIKASMDSLDEWLASNQEYEGSLEWTDDITKEIEKEIARRNSKSEIMLSKIKLTLPVSIIERMRESDKNYTQKGYSPEWDSTLQRILEKLIKAKTKQLSELFDEPPPDEVAACYQPKSHCSADQPAHQEGDHFR